MAAASADRSGPRCGNDKEHIFRSVVSTTGAPRRGTRKALVAVGHAILVIVYHVLKRGEPYQDLGANYFDQRDQQNVRRRLVRRLEQLGYEVNLAAVAEVS